MDTGFFYVSELFQKQPGGYETLCAREIRLSVFGREGSSFSAGNDQDIPVPVKDCVNPRNQQGGKFLQEKSDKFTNVGQEWSVYSLPADIIDIGKPAADLMTWIHCPEPPLPPVLITQAKLGKTNNRFLEVCVTETFHQLRLPIFERTATD
ncbi:hypothetical protein NPIL_412301 [Nephila pilipes]|uniref:Uncharacterized protein n=1 Tax=Nephila pilipes TaxID=299642 RepID=A0A8X6N6F7_NEPPI|nr:hypothetical protein NPIL_412301 [Nephila pilipes]